MPLSDLLDTYILGEEFFVLSSALVSKLHGKNKLILDNFFVGGLNSSVESSVTSIYNYLTGERQYFINKIEINNRISKSFLNVMSTKMSSTNFNMFLCTLGIYADQINDIYNTYFDHRTREYTYPLQKRYEDTEIKLDEMIDNMKHSFSQFNVEYKFDKTEDIKYILQQMMTFDSEKCNFETDINVVIFILAKAYHRKQKKLQPVIPSYNMPVEDHLVQEEIQE